MGNRRIGFSKKNVSVEFLFIIFFWGRMVCQIGMFFDWLVWDCYGCWMSSGFCLLGAGEEESGVLWEVKWRKRNILHVMHSCRYRQRWRIQKAMYKEWGRGWGGTYSRANQCISKGNTSFKAPWGWNWRYRFGGGCGSDRRRFRASRKNRRRRRD